MVLVSQPLHLRRLQQAAVKRGLAHGLQVQKHHSTVEAREPFRGRAPNPGLGVLMAKLPECVPGKRKENRFNPVAAGEVLCQTYFAGERYNFYPSFTAMKIKTF